MNRDQIYVPCLWCSIWIVTLKIAIYVIIEDGWILYWQPTLFWVGRKWAVLNKNIMDRCFTLNWEQVNVPYFGVWSDYSIPDCNISIKCQWIPYFKIESKDVFIRSDVICFRWYDMCFLFSGEMTRYVIHVYIMCLANIRSGQQRPDESSQNISSSQCLRGTDGWKTCNSNSSDNVFY